MLEKIREQIHEIRNFCAPFDLRFADLEERITQHSIFFDAQIEEMGSGILNNSINIEELLERINRIESALKLSRKTERPSMAARMMDCGGSETAPPQQSDDLRSNELKRPEIKFKVASSFAPPRGAPEDRSPHAIRMTSPSAAEIL